LIPRSRSSLRPAQVRDGCLTWWARRV
jgi:hypothetical protein